MAGDFLFTMWLREAELVVMRECEYEPGEFTMYPHHWREYYDVGMTPEAAFWAKIYRRRTKQATPSTPETAAAPSFPWTQLTLQFPSSGVTEPEQ